MQTNIFYIVCSESSLITFDARNPSHKNIVRDVSAEQDKDGISVESLNDTEEITEKELDALISSANPYLIDLQR